MILFVTNQIPHYRVAFFKRLAERYDLTVAHSGKPVGDPGFEEIVLPTQRYSGLYVQKGLRKLLNSGRYDIVIATFDVRWISTLWAYYSHREKVTWVWWGLDFGANALASKIKLFIANGSGPVIFYSHGVKKKFENMLKNEERLHVANNTFEVPNRVRSYENRNKDCFINVGSLVPRKRNDVLISGFAEVLSQSQKDLKLVLIGDGPQRAELEALVERLNLEKHVRFLGEVNSPEKLKDYYSKALASVSVGQAGLAVLQSMAFGVPFVTSHAAISGGEKYNVSPGVNGCFFDGSQAELVQVMLSLVRCPDYARELGENAYEYYSEHCSMEKMVGSFSNVIEAFR